MVLPKRLFYTLEDAAKRANCSVEDLLHYAYMGILQLCFLVPEGGIINDYYDDTSPEDEFIIIKSEGAILNEKPIEKIENIAVNYQTMYTSITENTLLTNNGIEHDTFIFGLLALSYGDARQLYYEWNKEKQLKDVIGIVTASLPRVNKIIRQTEGYVPFEFEFSAYWYMKTSNIYITDYELELLKNGGDYYFLYDEFIFDEYKKQNRTCTIARNSKSINAQNKFIKALLHHYYGEDVANNPRPYIENKNGEIRKDFENKGLSSNLPNGVTVKKWVDSAELEIDL